jgi:hypothetical protein
MNSKEWRERKVVTDFDTEAMLADLAECEADKETAIDDLRNEHKHAVAMEAERDDLRRKLADAERKGKELCCAYGNSLMANAALREALESIAKNSCCQPCMEAGLVAKMALAAALPADGLASDLIAALSRPAGTEQTHAGNPNVYPRSAVTMKVVGQLALPADGLAEEVRKYMRHTIDCVLISRSDIGPYICTCGLDALLVKLGGKT